MYMSLSLQQLCQVDPYDAYIAAMKLRWCVAFRLLVYGKGKIWTGGFRFVASLLFTAPALLMHDKNKNHIARNVVATLHYREMLLY